MMRLLFKLRYFFTLKSGKVDSCYSKVINELIESNPIIKNDYSDVHDCIFNIRLNGTNIWVENRFYAFGKISGNDLMLTSDVAYKLYLIYKEELRECRKNRLNNLRNRILK